MNTSDACAIVKRNPFMRVRFSRPPQIDLLLEGFTYEVRDRDVICAVIHAEKPLRTDLLVERLQKNISSEDPTTLIAELLSARVLVEENYRSPLQDAAEHWQHRGWLDALVLHLSSRNVSYMDFGANKFIGPVSDRSMIAHEAKLFSESEEVLPTRGDILLPDGDGGCFRGTLYGAMSERRTGRPWTGTPVDEELLSSILRYANLESFANRKEMLDDTSKEGSATFDRSSFSALETYVVVNNVMGVPQGVYRYSVMRNALVLVGLGDCDERLVQMCIGQAKVRNCAVAFVIGAHWSLYYSRYRHPRAYRNLLINCAELAHYYILCATAAKLSNFITPAFNDEIAEEIIGEPCTEIGPLYMVAIG